MNPTVRDVNLRTEAAHKRAVWDQVVSSYTDPRTLEILGAVLRDADVDGRDAGALAGAVQSWVERSIRYVREHPERLCAPWVTVRLGYGDCDDMAILVASLLRAARVPVRCAFGGWAPASSAPPVLPLKHVWSEAWIAPPHTAGEWVALETVRRVPAGWRATEWRRSLGDRVRLDTLGDAPGKIVEGDPHGETDGIEVVPRRREAAAPALGQGRATAALPPARGPLRW